MYGVTEKKNSCKGFIVSLMPCIFYLFYLRIHITIMNHSFLPPNIRMWGGGYLSFEIWTKRGFMNKLLRSRGVVWKGESSVRTGRGWSKLFHEFSLRKASFHYYWNFCLVNIRTCCKQYIDLFFHVVYFLLENDIL